MIWSIALAAGWGGGWTNRLKSLVLAAATTVVTVVALAGVSATLLAERIDDRAIGRTFRHAVEGEPAAFSSDFNYDSVNGESISITYWRIETPGALIPGVPPTAKVGDWFVSPELDRRIRTEPVLTGRFGDNPGVIAKAGIGAADELLAYRIVGPDVPLRTRRTAESGSEWSGIKSAVGAPTVALATFGLVLVIGVGFLRAALGPVSIGLERRLQVLHLLGAPRLTLARLSVLSTAVVALPGAVLAAGAWYWVAPKLSSVPLVGERVFRGDMAVPLWVVAVTAAVVTVLAGLLGLRHLGSRVGSRPTSRIPQSPALWRALPLAGSIGLILYSTTQSGEAAVRLLLTWLLAASLSVTFALPVIVNHLGAAIAKGASPLAKLVGRRLSWNAATSARSLMALAGVAVLIPVAASYIAVARQGDDEPPQSTVAAIIVNGDLDNSELRWLETEAGGDFLDVYRTEPMGNAAPTFTWVGDCSSLGRYVEFEKCGPDGIMVAPEAAGAFAKHGTGSTAPPAATRFAYRLLVAPDELRAERVVRKFVVNRAGPDLSVRSPADGVQKEDRAVPWILAAFKIAGVGAFAALLLSVATNASQSARTRLRLIALGAKLATIRRLAAAESFALVAIVGLGGTAVGTIGAVAYALVDGSVPPNYAPSAVIAAATIAAATLAGLTAAVHITAPGAQRALNNPD